MMTFIALKSAFIPLYSWLPKAHGTPGASSAVSALLSGLHIKSSLYLLIRFQDVFYPIADHNLILIMGLITALAGVVMSMSQTDIKLVLAYSTIAQVGLITVGLSTSYVGSYNYYGGLFHMINHAVFKAALFLSAGIISYAYGTRDIRQVRGVFKTMPGLATAISLALLGVIGTPLFNGNISKYFIMYDLSSWLNIAVTIVNLGSIIICLKFATMLFGEPEGKVNVSGDIFRFGPVYFLGLACFLLGVFGIQVIYFLFGADLSISTAGYIEKTIIFAISLVVGFLIHKYVVDKYKIFNKIRRFEIGFRGMCLSVGFVLAVILVVVGF
jgi:multicomponent Na+:H+ antiporter subunit D